MDFLLAVFLFLAGLSVTLFRGGPIAYPLLWGLACFAATALRRGLSPREVLRSVLKGAVKVRVVLRILLLIGFLTGSWRACGTVAFFVYYGVSVLEPQFFVLFAFLLSAGVSFLLGSSFGTTGTIGVVLMLLARGGGVPPEMAAGAVLSGAYFGDRSSPVSSCAALVAALTDTALHDNVRAMLRSAFIPFLLTAGLYGVVSLAYPLNAVDPQTLAELPRLFRLGPPVLLPAALILILAVFRVSVPLSMVLSILAASAVGMGVQGISLAELARALIRGYEPGTTGGLAGLMAGGGLLSMTNALATVFLASGFSGIFEDAGLLKDVKAFLYRLSKRLSLFQTTLLTSFFSAAFSCSQTLAIVLTHQLVSPLYGDRTPRLALDLSDAAALAPDLIPWNLALFGPLVILSTGAKTLLWLYFPLAVPLMRLFTERRTKKGPFHDAP